MLIREHFDPPDMVLRRTVLTAAGTALLTTLAGCADSVADAETTADAEPPTGTSTPEPTVELVDDELIRRNAGADDELAGVAGTLENVSDETLPEVVVTAAFRTESGAFVEEGRTDLSEMAPGRRWRFEIYFHGSGESARAVADYDLAVDVTT